MDDLVRAGKILYPAVSNWAAWQIATVLGISERHRWARFECIQPMYSLLKRQVEVEILPLAQSEQVRVISYSPLGGGILSGKYGSKIPDRNRFLANPAYLRRYADPMHQEITARFLEHAEIVNIHPATLAVAWVMMHPALTAPDYCNEGEMMDIDQVRRVRAGIPALKGYVWFQNGGVSVTPAAIAEEHIRLMRELLTRGPMHIVYPDEEYPRREQSMARLAQFFAVAPAELALMRGVSEGYQTILRGLDWQPGDQIITTVEEEASVFLPTLHVRDRLGVEVVKAPLVDDLEGQCAVIESCLTDRTRLIVVSHVTTDLGFRLPVEQICQLARARGVLTFVDTAHSMGLYPIDLHAIGCDFAGILSYKWMYAPYAAGALYIRKEHLNTVAVTYAGGRAEAWLDYETDTYALKETAGRFEYGPWSWPLIHAWAFAAGYLTDIGRDQIWARTVDLTTRLKQGLAAIPGVTLYTPVSPHLSAALVSFGVAGWEGRALAQTLRERWNIIIKPLYISTNGLRASVPFFLLEEEIDRLVEAVATLAAIPQASKGSS